MPAKKKTTKKKQAKISIWRQKFGLRVAAPILLVAVFTSWGAYTLTTSSADSQGGGTLIIKVIPDGVAPQDANILGTMVLASKLSDYGNCSLDAGSTNGNPRGVAVPLTSAGITCTGLDFRGWNHTDSTRTTEDNAGTYYPMFRTGGDPTLEHTNTQLSILSDTSNGHVNSCQPGYCQFSFNSGTVTIGLTITPYITPLSTLPHLSASSITSTSAVINWGDLVNATKPRTVYGWYIYQDNGQEVIKDASLGGNPGTELPPEARSYTATGLTPCTTYHFGMQMMQAVIGSQTEVGTDTLNFITVTTAGCPVSATTVPRSATGTSRNTGSGDSTGTITQPNDGTVTTEGTSSEGITLNAVDTASKQAQTNTQHRRNLALTIGLVVVAIGLASVIATKLIRKRA